MLVNPIEDAVKMLSTERHIEKCSVNTLFKLIVIGTPWSTSIGVDAFTR